jgi:hypothetical protein
VGFSGKTGNFYYFRLVFELESRQTSNKIHEFVWRPGQEIKGCRSLIFRSRTDKIHGVKEVVKGKGLIFKKLGSKCIKGKVPEHLN